MDYTTKVVGVHGMTQAEVDQETIDLVLGGLVAIAYASAALEDEQQNMTESERLDEMSLRRWEST